MLGYEISVRTSQQTDHVSVTVPSPAKILRHTLSSLEGVDVASTLGPCVCVYGRKRGVTCVRCKVCIRCFIENDTTEHFWNAAVNPMSRHWKRFTLPAHDVIFLASMLLSVHRALWPIWMSFIGSRIWRNSLFVQSKNGIKHFTLIMSYFHAPHKSQQASTCQLQKSTTEHFLDANA
jgi:hypothetical protein